VLIDFFILEPGVYSFVTMATEPEDFADTLRWKHSMGQPGIERLLDHFKVESSSYKFQTGGSQV
jgi:hypothetical protein